MISLQQSHLPESAEILDLLNKIEFEGLFYSHDKLAQLQGGLPWKKCLAEMWTKDKTSEQSAQAVTNTRVVKITKHNEPLGATVRNEGDKVVIGRIVKGGAAERSGALHPGDEVSISWKYFENCFFCKYFENLVKNNLKTLLKIF